MNELKCPHCGKTKTRITKKRKAKTYGWYNGLGEPLLKYIYYVTCGCCHSRGPTADTEGEAIAAWNCRADINSEPLTAKQLRNMHGKPIWIEEYNEWAIVEVDTNGTYKNNPFASGVNFNHDIIKRKLTCYTGEPPKGE